MPRERSLNVAEQPESTSLYRHSSSENVHSTLTLNNHASNRGSLLPLSHLHDSLAPTSSSRASSSQAIFSHNPARTPPQILRPHTYDYRAPSQLHPIHTQLYTKFPPLSKYQDHHLQLYRGGSCLC